MYLTLFRLLLSLIATFTLVIIAETMSKTEQAYIDHWNRVVEDEERQLATGRAYAISQPYEVSIDLALLDLDRPR